MNNTNKNPVVVVKNMTSENSGKRQKQIFACLFPQRNVDVYFT